MMARSTSNFTKPAIIAIAAILLFISSVMVLRSWTQDNYFPNGESYYTMRMASELQKDPYLFEDDIQAKPYFPTIYHFIVAFGIGTLGSGAFMIIPILLGLFTAISFYKLLKNLGLPAKNALASMLLLVATPPFLTSFTSLSPLGFAIFLSSATLSFYFQKDYWEFPWKVSGKVYYFLAIVSFSLLAITSILAFICTFFFILLLSVVEGRNLRSIMFITSFPLVLLIPVFAYTSYYSYTAGTLGFHPFDLRQSFSIFGSLTGLDLFYTIIASLGLVIIWNYIKEMRIYHTVFLVFALLSLSNPLLRFYASAIMTVYCVIAIKHLYYRKWELEITKTGTIILICCALVFSIVSQFGTLISAEPTANTGKFMDRAILSGNGTILTGPEYGFYLQWLGQRKTILDGNSMRYSDFTERFGDYEFLMRNTRIKDAEPILQKYGIEQIIITPRMKDELWNQKEQGFLLLIRNSAKFKLVEKNEDGFEHWRYNP